MSLIQPVLFATIPGHLLPFFHTEPISILGVSIDVQLGSSLVIEKAMATQHAFFLSKYLFVILAMYFVSLSYWKIKPFSAIPWRCNDSRSFFFFFWEGISIYFTAFIPTQTLPIASTSREVIYPKPLDWLRRNQLLELCTKVTKAHLAYSIKLDHFERL